MPERDLDEDGRCRACHEVERDLARDQFPAVRVAMVFEEDLEDGEEPPRRFAIVGKRTEVFRGTAIGWCVRADFLDGTSDWLHNVKAEEVNGG